MKEIKEFEAIRKMPWFKKTNAVWNENGFNSRKSIGHMMDLIAECQPKSFSEWFDFYVNYRRSQHDEEYLFEKIAIPFSKAANLSLLQSYQSIYVRVIYETYIGYEREQAAIEKLRSYYKSKKYS